jgi:hypothetical protein
MPFFCVMSCFAAPVYHASPSFPRTHTYHNNTPTPNKTNKPHSAFEAAHVGDFVESIRRGYERVAPLTNNLKALPEAASTEPWDGKDAAVEAEDEFSLDDLGIGGGSGGGDDDKEL